MPKLKKIIEQVNKDNAPPDGWQPKDAVSHSKKQDKPEAGKLYALTGAPGSKCIANGNTWAESVVGEEVKPNWSYRKNKDGFMGSENRVMNK